MTISLSVSDVFEYDGEGDGDFSDIIMSFECVSGHGNWKSHSSVLFSVIIIIVSMGIAFHELPLPLN